MRFAWAIAMMAAACTHASSSDALWQTSLRLGADTAWKYAERASADFDGDGQQETAVLSADVTLDARGHPLWEDGHRWRLYFEESDGTRTYAYNAFVPNGRVDAMIPAAQQPGDRPVVTLLVRSATSTALFEIAYGGPNRIRVRNVYERAVDTHLQGTPRI